MFVQWASKYQVPLKKSEQLSAIGKHRLNYSLDYNLVETLIFEVQKQSGHDETTGWPYKS